jgi:hypothetical protein
LFGIVRAHEFIEKNKHLTIQELINRLLVLKKINSDFLKKFRDASNTFNNHIVFNPILKTQTRFNETKTETRDNQIWGNDKFFPEQALDHAMGNIGRRDLNSLMPIEYENLAIRLPAGVQVDSAVYGMMNIWSWSNVDDLNTKIPQIERAKFTFKITDIVKTEHLQKTQSIYWNNENYCCVKYFKKFKMGTISDSKDIFPFKFKIQEDLSKIKCFCESQAEKRLILFNNKNKNITSNCHNFLGGSFFICANQQKKCSFFLFMKARNFDSLDTFDRLIEEDLNWANKNSEFANNEDHEDGAVESDGEEEEEVTSDEDDEISEVDTEDEEVEEDYDEVENSMEENTMEHDD